MNTGNSITSAAEARGTRLHCLLTGDATRLVLKWRLHSPIQSLSEMCCGIDRAAPVPSHNSFFPGCSSADVYFSWHVLVGSEPPISHIFIG